MRDCTHQSFFGCLELSFSGSVRQRVVVVVIRRRPEEVAGAAGVEAAGLVRRQHFARRHRLSRRQPAQWLSVRLSLGKTIRAWVTRSSGSMPRGELLRKPVTEAVIWRPSTTARHTLAYSTQLAHTDFIAQSTRE